ncbi:phosphoadenosine phosphosulfate reductase family protein [Thermanaerothrix sp. 4228-RoL]|uniref:Phosphoadenosine phosphosulfate reductase family protein n=1 Tax=Thermanaerothrix solaris TaxID=3058434 RepID=A0ABU3NN71_9CHLR|nr:phosphoadenosine phosphosulfate reductase family protein [Thermanaerothrix sp. 4228-RoL]MDT8898282.1 phosphoadenosine phosphosulfate reductase family protein [Thermanaerothrix sp. 4228-RoL]
MSSEQPVRHIVSLSGGKDSTALAIYLRDRIPDLEYVFCDTGEELPETYEYLDRLEIFLGKEIKKIKARQSFEDMLKARGGFLPSGQVRWCTEYLKIKPFEEFVGDSICHNYIGIRADEIHRKGYISTKPNIIPHYPFIEENIKKEDVIRILEESGLGLPAYYEWRSRSGCYFCFFQQKNEWLGLLRHHPDLYEKAESYEKENPETGERYTWMPKESLRDLRSPERQKSIIQEFERRKTRQQRPESKLALIDLFDAEETNEESCLICHL